MMSSVPTDSLTRRHQSSSSDHPLVNINLLSRILPYAATELNSPFTFKSVCSAWAETVVHWGAGSNSWKFYFDRLRKQDPEKAHVQLMKLLKFSFNSIVKSPKDYWNLDAIFFACDELDHFHIDFSVRRSDFCCRSIEAACNSLCRNDKLAKNYDDFKYCFFNFCRLFRGQSLTIMLCGTLRACFTCYPGRAIIAKTIIEDHYQSSVEDALCRSIIERDSFWLMVGLIQTLPIWLNKLKTLNRLHIARKVLLEYNLFLVDATVNTSSNELRQLASTLKMYLGDSFLHRLFLQTHHRTAEFVLSCALTDCGINHFTALIEVASILEDKHFVDLCSEVNGVKGLPLFSLACSSNRDTQAKIILSKIRNIKNLALVRQFIEAGQPGSSFKNAIHYALEFSPLSIVKALVEIIKSAGDHEYFKSVLAPSHAALLVAEDSALPPLYFALRNDRNERNDSFQTVQYFTNLLQVEFGVDCLQNQLDYIDREVCLFRDHVIFQHAEYLADVIKTCFGWEGLESYIDRDPGLLECLLAPHQSGSPEYEMDGETHEFLLELSRKKSSNRSTN